MTHAAAPRPELVLALQQGIPVTPRPFQTLATSLHLEEAAVLHGLKHLRHKGILRRFGGIFDSRRLGYASTLCAVAMPSEQQDILLPRLCAFPEVTHCYERTVDPNLWFTLTAPKTDLAAHMETIRATLAPLPVSELPAIQRYKIGAVFDPRRKEAASPSSNTKTDANAAALSPADKALIRLLASDLPARSDLFADLARRVEWDTDALLQRLRTWQKDGVLRRIGMVAHHRRLGVAANGLCLWDVSDANVNAAGHALAALPEVSHCYRRRRCDAVPFTLYAMIHGESEDAVRARGQTIARRAHLPEPQIAFSTQEWKKTSPPFFATETA